MPLRAALLSLCEQLRGFFWHWQALEPEQQIHSMVLLCLLVSLVSNTLLHNVVPSQVLSVLLSVTTLQIRTLQSVQALLARMHHGEAFFVQK